MAQGDKLGKILFVYDHEYPHLWRDGLWAALKILENDFDIEYFNIREKVSDGAEKTFEDIDFVLGWGGFHSPVDNLVRNMTSPKGLCIGGNAFPYYPVYDVLFYETDWVKDFLKLEGNCVRAFGVNTDIFMSGDDDKIFDVISVGAFATWKRHFLLRGKSGNRLAIGQIQRGNPEESLGIVNGLLYDGVMVSDMVDPEELARFYCASKLCYIPADIMGGGERAILEARACGIEVECENDNPKLKELLTCLIPSEYDYAKSLKIGILSVL